MKIFEFKTKNNTSILALGAESAGNFCVFKNGKVYFSEDFGDLLDDNNFRKYKHKLNEFLRKNKIEPDIILTDLHPLYKTTLWGAELAKKYNEKHIQVQHHFAHIFSAIGEDVIFNFLRRGGPIFKQFSNPNFQNPDSFFGIAMDGTGYGTDGKIWGGEVFEITNPKLQITNKFNPPAGGQNSKFKIARIGHLENQAMIGGDLAIREPARMLIGILSKFQKKDGIYKYVKKYYTKNQFELLYNQLQNNFNCIETSSTGRILDAVSILLGFCGNERNYKHEPIELLEQNSTVPYNNLKPKIIKIYNEELGIMPARQCQTLAGGNYELCTTYLFEYLIKNLRKDKKRLAATAQLYIAEGLYKIVSKEKKELSSEASELSSFFSGGIANNKIISSYLETKGVFCAKKIPRGDAGLSFGQVCYFIFN